MADKVIVKAGQSYSSTAGLRGSTRDQFVSYVRGIDVPEDILESYGNEPKGITDPHNERAWRVAGFIAGFTFAGAAATAIGIAGLEIGGGAIAANVGAIIAARATVREILPPTYADYFLEAAARGTIAQTALSLVSYAGAVSDSVFGIPQTVNPAEENLYRAIYDLPFPSYWEALKQIRGPTAVLF